MSYFGQWFGEYDGDWFGADEDEEGRGFPALFILRADYTKRDEIDRKRRELDEIFRRAFRLASQNEAAADLVDIAAPALAESKASVPPEPRLDPPRIDWSAVAGQITAIAIAAERFVESVNENDEEEDDMIALLMAA